MNDRYMEECRNYLLQMNGGDSATQSTSKVRSTKTNLSIKKLSDRLKNTGSELGRLRGIFSSSVEVYTKR